MERNVIRRIRSPEPASNLGFGLDLSFRPFFVVSFFSLISNKTSEQKAIKSEPVYVTDREL